MPRKKANIHYIYKTTCNVTSRYYIGMHSTSNINDGYMGSGKRLRYSIRKHGKDNHVREILEYFDTREQLIEREIELITSDMIQDEFCMNLKNGGTGGFSVEQQKLNNQKSLAKQKILRETDLQWALKKSSKISSGNIRAYENGVRDKKYFFSWSGKTHSEQTKIKTSEKMKGRQLGDMNSQFGTCWITKNSENKKIKKEQLHTYLQMGWSKGRKNIF